MAPHGNRLPPQPDYPSPYQITATIDEKVQEADILTTKEIADRYSLIFDVDPYGFSIGMTILVHADGTIEQEKRPHIGSINFMEKPKRRRK